MSSKLSATIRVADVFQDAAAPLEKISAEIQQLKKERIGCAELLDAIEAICREHPHDTFSFDDDVTFGFTAGWEAACTRIKSMLEGKMKSTHSEGDDPHEEEPPGTD